MLWKFLIGYIVIMSLVTFFNFGVDKRRAVKEKWRIPERTLFLLAAAGGSPGALLGMLVFHHKTQKVLFTVGMPLLLALQILTVVLFFD